MPLQAGDPVLGGDVSETRGAADGVEAGDAVMIDGGEMAPVDTDAGELAGVARHDAGLTTGNALGLSGAHVVAAADGVEAGDRVDGGNATDTTTGAVDTADGGPALALSDEGGTWSGEDGTYDVPDGYAVVHF